MSTTDGKIANTMNQYCMLIFVLYDNEMPPIYLCLSFDRIDDEAFYAFMYIRERNVQFKK